MRILGLLGGMSWESSSLYYINMNRAVREKLGGTRSCKMIMYSFDFAEIEELQAAGNWSALAKMLAKAATALQKAGAESLVLCTNTMHKVATEVENASGLPILHIADFTGAKIVQRGLLKVGLLATRYTMEQDFYKERLKERFGLEVLVPSKEQRDAVHDVIYNELVRGIVREESKQAYLEIVRSMVDNGAECIILGCTEITLLIGQADCPTPVFDTTALHCQGAVEWAFSIGSSV
jgi:aspartate racemase